MAAISATVLLKMVSKWMVHAAIGTTATFANVIGKEQRYVAECMGR